ncbi:hypothetical protein L21SP5_01703 [Salinivirga cyanobacteriivorans]|uniref:Uncharacterized protein n=1 Tax=Salinivirga cyanobacteriivorans TaxID=1307839 RepID=A0A0S2HZ99_9BACT|nr:hypothetical protein [Salinivirga cyanobacteriivorans]ALO15345.1 hypothetical protein L21SP5_01703 [Salinivirga cyanobacteriivorans]
MQTVLKLSNKIIWPVIAFGITMAMFEASVVVYLRELYYPEGFSFPLKLTSDNVAITEFLREAASLIMIGAVAWLAGRGFTQRFAWFLIIFAIWDIFYYVFLKAILNWPESFMTWDILFLIPVHWTGPVIAPVLISLIMIALGTLMLKFTALKQAPAIINKNEWWFLGSGAFVVFTAFILDYTIYLISNFGKALQGSLIEKLTALSLKYKPDYFPWWLFLTGVALLVFMISRYYIRNKQTSPTD